MSKSRAASIMKSAVDCTLLTEILNEFTLLKLSMLCSNSLLSMILQLKKPLIYTIWGTWEVLFLLTRKVGRGTAENTSFLGWNINRALGVRIKRLQHMLK